MNLVDRILNGDTRAISRAMTLIENGDAQSREILKGVFPHTGRGRVIGVTGAPGSGKSTLVDKLAQAYRQQRKSVGIVAVDPTSPFSGGALLADRIRMSALYNDEGVFIRSMATRGHLGGLSRTTQELVNVLDAAGKEVILVETVGVGQDEIEIVRVADVTIVVLVPGMGDDIQALKAGIMEIGDLFAINKSDRPQAEKLEQELEVALSLATRPDGWKPCIARTIATQGEGISNLLQQIKSFEQFRKSSPQWAGQRRRNVEESLINLLRESLLENTIQQNGVWDKIQAASRAVGDRKIDPYSAVEEILKNLK